MCCRCRDTKGDLYRSFINFTYRLPEERGGQGEGIANLPSDLTRAVFANVAANQTLALSLDLKRSLPSVDDLVAVRL